MPRGPGKKENYNLDYSRFNSFDRDDVEEDTKPGVPQNVEEADAAGGVPDMRDMLRRMPPELQEAYHIMSIAQANGDTEAQQKASALALKAVEKGGPEVKDAFMKNIAEQMPEIAGKLNKDMSGIVAEGVDPKTMLDGLQKEAAEQAARKQLSGAGYPQEAETNIEKLREQMLEGQKATRREMEELEKRQAELERIKDPEDFMKFMTQEGITQEDLQRIFSGDGEFMQARFNETLEKRSTEKSKETTDALKKVEELHGTLFGPDTPEETHAPEPAPERPARRAPSPPKEPEVTIPMYRLQYQKDEAGKYTTVELKCSLPGIADMSMINLDISARHLRLSTDAPAPRYAVNAGPFPVLIDPSAARAKYSKKREELSISVPAKLD